MTCEPGLRFDASLQFDLDLDLDLAVQRLLDEACRLLAGVPLLGEPSALTPQVSRWTKGLLLLNERTPTPVLAKPSVLRLTATADGVRAYAFDVAAYQPTA